LLKAKTEMPKSISRRTFAAASAGLIAAPGLMVAQEQESKPAESKQEPKTKEIREPKEKAFTRDYEPPKFKPSWKNEQVNRQMAADFVIYAHSDLKMVEKLLEREPGLLNATLDWGDGDWETALGGASHMGRKDIVEFLLRKGARIDIFCCAMMGLLDSVKAMLTLQPGLIDAKGPHGFTLHFHAQVGQEDSVKVLEYLQSQKEVELKPLPPFLKRKKK
jgi:hypothetical protein